MEVNKVGMPSKKYKKPVSKASSEIERSIALANILPLNQEMPDIFRIVRHKNKEVRKELSAKQSAVKKEFGAILPNLTTLTLLYDYSVENAKPETENTLRKTLIGSLTNLPDNFFEILRTLSINGLKDKELKVNKLLSADYADIWRLAISYDYIRNYRKSLLDLLFRLEAERKGLYRTGGYFPLHLQAEIDLDSEGNLKVFGIVAEIGKFDHNRLRLCPYCKYVYWMKREDSNTCGKRSCVDAFQYQKKKNGGSK